MEEQAAHMHAHSAGKEEAEFPRLALPSQRKNWMTTKRSEMIDAGAEADGEQTPTLMTRRTKRKRSDPSLPNPPDNLDFLTAYGGRKAWSSTSVQLGGVTKAKNALDRPTSKTLHPAKKSRGGGVCFSSVLEGVGTSRYIGSGIFFIKAKSKKRMRISDPTFR